jgi:hypothetical protein
MQGIDIFDMSPLPSDRLGTFEDPIVVKSAGEEFQLGCTGSPADSHTVLWLVVSFAVTTPSIHLQLAHTVDEEPLANFESIDIAQTSI